MTNEEKVKEWSTGCSKLSLREYLGMDILTYEKYQRGEYVAEVVSIYEEALQAWGVKSQIHKASEELFELGIAMHHWYNDKVTGEQLADEIADVEIVCAQLRFLIGNDLTNNAKIKKLQRLRGRIEIAKKKTGSN